jgi:signal transduction histidine kinase
MRKNNPKFFAFLWFLFVLILLTVLFTAAFYLTGYLYRVVHLNPPSLLVQIINSFLGLIFMALVIRIFARYFRTQQFDAFAPVIEAMERISRGDFSIRLDNIPQDSIISGLVASVNKMALELGQMENMRQEFVSNVSHEIQSPLTSIRGFAQALKGDRLNDEERLHYLEIIEVESMRLSRLADDLLKLASLEADQVKFEPHSYQLDKQIRSLILACEPQWMEKAIDMQISLEEVNIIADEDLLSQVWINLIHNSIKFSPQCARINITLQQRGDNALFSISDTGIGISEEDLARVFERFYKADKSRQRSIGGSGLGLSIAKKIVEIHKGEISLQSKLGAGTTVTISLPIPK